MDKIISVSKNVRLTCIFYEPFRFRNTACVIQVGDHFSQSMLVTEIHVNRGCPSDERVLSLKCDIQNATFDAELGESFPCSVYVPPENTKAINLKVISWSKEVRLVVESSDERRGRPCQGTLIIDGTRLGPVTAYEPLSSSNNRELIVSNSDANLDGFIFSSIQAGRTCYFDPDPNSAVSAAV